jgi:predicted nucleic acid-binding protein
MPLLIDTGPLYALADADDDWHVRVRDFLRKDRRSLMVPVTVVPEATYLIRKRLGVSAEKKFADSLAMKEIAVENLTTSDLRRSSELLETYPFLGFVDASVVAMAERLKLPTLVTTDRRDFARVRPRHIDMFELLP